MSVETLTPTVNTTWRLDVNTAADGSPENFIQVRALNAFQPAVNSTVQDASDYDSDGWGSDAVTQRKWQLVGTALRKYAEGGAYDPGQEFLRRAADNLTLVHVRWYERQGGGNGEAYEGFGLVQWAPQGGDPTGLNAVQVTILGQGPRTAITNPAKTSGS